MRLHPFVAPILLLMGLGGLHNAAYGLEHKDSAKIIQRFLKLKKSTSWKIVRQTKLRFDTFHPQGLVKIGREFYLSSVEKIKPTRKFKKPDDRGRDRTAGVGKAHLFRFSRKGRLLGRTRLGGGRVYHPGGMDYDGSFLWVPVAEYRPNSDSILYKVEPKSLKATKVFQVEDHIGGIVHDTAEDALYGVSWGSRRIHKWTVRGKVEKPNGSHYIDYQDCKYLRDYWMLCSGLNKYQPSGSHPPFVLGGLELINLKTLTAVHQVPLSVYTPKQVVLTQNPMDVELRGDTLRFYFVPEDNPSILYVVEPEILSD